MFALVTPRTKDSVIPILPPLQFAGNTISENLLLRVYPILAMVHKPSFHAASTDSPAIVNAPSVESAPVKQKAALTNFLLTTMPVETLVTPNSGQVYTLVEACATGEYIKEAATTAIEVKYLESITFTVRRLPVQALAAECMRATTLSSAYNSAPVGPGCAASRLLRGRPSH